MISSRQFLATFLVICSLFTRCIKAIDAEFIVDPITGQSQHQELIQDISASLLEDATKSSSVMPKFVTEQFSHKFFYEKYSFTEWDWSTFNNLLMKSTYYCTKNQTFAESWTLPIKCEYYLIIRALRRLKDIENELNPKEQHILKSYIEEIYGTKEDHEKRKERLKSSFDERLYNSSSTSAQRLLRVKTLLETNDILHLQDNRFLAQHKILEECSSQLLWNQHEDNNNHPSINKIVSFQFFMQLTTSHFNDYYFHQKKISEMKFFQFFVKSFLQWEKKRNNLPETPPTIAKELGIQYQFQLIIAYDVNLLGHYPGNAASFLSDFEIAVRFFLKNHFQSISFYSITGLENTYAHESMDMYFWKEIIPRGFLPFYLFPHLFRQAIQLHHNHNNHDQQQQQHQSIEYYFFMKDSLLISDITFFDEILLSLGYQNIYFPNFGIFVPRNIPRNDFLVFHQQHLDMMKEFPLTAYVLNNSYLNTPPNLPPQQVPSSRVHVNGEEYNWNHMFFSLLDVYSVYQPDLIKRNEFLNISAIGNYSFIIETDPGHGNQWISSEFKGNVNRYRSLVERTRRTIAKWLNRHEWYERYHTCIVEQVNGIIDREVDEEQQGNEENRAAILLAIRKGHTAEKKKTKNEEEEDSNETMYSHPLQFFWRPNQLIYEIGGLFSFINF